MLLIIKYQDGKMVKEVLIDSTVLPEFQKKYGLVLIQPYNKKDTFNEEV